MATSPIGLQQGYGIGSGVQNLAPFSIIANRAPTTLDRARIGTFWAYTGANNIYCLTSVTNGQSNWLTLSSGGSGIFIDLTVNGPSDFNGNITQNAGVTSLLATTVNGNLTTNTGAVTFNAPVAAPLPTLTIFGQNTAAQGSLNIQANVAGLHNAIQVYNTNAASTGSCEIAVITTSQDFGTARIGDSQVRFTTQSAALGTAEYTIGKDASANQFVISEGPSLGTDNRLTISATNGAVNMPSQPSFNAFLQPGVTNQTGNSGSPDILFNNVSQVGTAYNATTGEFTAPVAGRYLIGARVTVNNLSAPMSNGYLQIDKYPPVGAVPNVSEVCGLCNPVACMTATTSPDRYTFQGQTVLAMAVGERIKIHCVVKDGGGNTAGYSGTGERETLFYGQLLS